MSDFGKLAVDAPPRWVDHDGRVWKTPQILGRLKFGRCPGHAALRSFVLRRDDYRCVRCGSDRALVADHVISRRNGGAHHPDNLQALCEPCNARKASKEDAPSLPWHQQGSR